MTVQPGAVNAGPRATGAGPGSVGVQPGVVGVRPGVPVQLTLLGRPPARRRPPATPAPPADVDPVARVCVDVQPAHLDRVFEYLVPEPMAQAARPGVRVRVRFGGSDATGWLLARAAAAEHDGRLTPLRAVVSPEPVLAADVAVLARAVADRYAGTLPDVLRLAVPPRHARVEHEQWPDPVPAGAPQASAAAWSRYRGGSAFVGHVHAGVPARAVWTALPGSVDQAWTTAVAQAVAAAVLGGRGAVVVVPDAADVLEVTDALARAGLTAWRPGVRGGVVTLTAGLGPAPRYRAFLAASRGLADVVVGTRAAAFAPVHDLGLAVCWDDGDDLHAEPRAPYPHVREVLALRSELAGAGLLIGGYGRSVPAQGLVERGWAHAVAADRSTTRAATPRVRALTSAELAAHGPAAGARLPTPAWRALHDRLTDGPVLVQVPRAGYLPVVACAGCRTPAPCRSCGGPLAVADAGAVAQCSWCGRLAGQWRCPVCGSAALRAVRVGSRRTAEELGRAFPGVPVTVSGADTPGGPVRRVAATPRLVVATPGAEPQADGGFHVAVLLDAAVGAAVRAETETARRWLNAAARVRPDGEVLLVGDGPARPTQALVRWDPAWLASTDLAERTELGLPPATRAVELVGDRAAVASVAARVLAQVPDASPLGPAPAADDAVRMLIRTPLRDGARLAAAVAGAAGVRSARHEPGTVRARIDPVDLG